ncbi:Zinc finger, CCHC domain-containing protein [Podila humilis]|nr:Zinc finger, CCHC domain-containing protein [Podila humilis]
MKINRRHFVGILYDCILFEYASLVYGSHGRSKEKHERKQRTHSEEQEQQHQHQQKDFNNSNNNNNNNNNQHYPQTTYTLSLDDLADTFAFIADFYKHHRSLMDIPCDQFITRNQLHTVAGLVDYIEELDRGSFEIFPHPVELREETPSFASSASTRRERRKQERSGYRIGTSGLLSNGPPPPPRSSSSSGRSSINRSGASGGRERGGMGMGNTGLTTPSSWSDLYYSHRRQSLVPNTNTDHEEEEEEIDDDDEYSIIIPGLSKTDIQTFLWEYAYMPEDYHDDIATLIRYLRRDEWLMNGSKGSIVAFDWDLEGVQKFSRDYNQSKIHKVKEREKEEVKRQQEMALKQQEEWNRQLELAREQEAQRRVKMMDSFIWKMHKSLSISPATSEDITNLISTLEIEIAEFFNYCFVTLSAIGSFAAEFHTNEDDLDLTLGGNVKHITASDLADALEHNQYENVSISINPFQQPLSPNSPPLTSRVSFMDPRTAITCHITLHDPLATHRSKLIKTYNLIEPRFGPMLVALKHLVIHRHLDNHNFMPFSNYALELMLITFLQTENPPILPKLQQPTQRRFLDGKDYSSGNDSSKDLGGGVIVIEEEEEEGRPLKELIVQGIDCSFDRDWEYYTRRSFGAKNTKTVAELVLDFCRFFGYVFDYESKEVNSRLGSFRWRPDHHQNHHHQQQQQLLRNHASLLSITNTPTTKATPTSSTSTNTNTAAGASLLSLATNPTAPTTTTAIPTGFLSRSNSLTLVTAQSSSMSRQQQQQQQQDQQLLESVSVSLSYSHAAAAVDGGGGSGGIVFQVMDPFMIGTNVTAQCQGERVRMVKECFQDAYEALNEGDINQAFSHSV